MLTIKEAIKEEHQARLVLYNLEARHGKNAKHVLRRNIKEAQSRLDTLKLARIKLFILDHSHCMTRRLQLYLVFYTWKTTSMDLLQAKDFVDAEITISKEWNRIHQTFFHRKPCHIKEARTTKC